MSTRSILLLVALVLFAPATALHAQSDGSGAGGVRGPLDLPAGGNTNSEDEEEETETINFYGSTFEGNGFFWCMDRSGSMSGNKLTILKSEVVNAINQLSNRADFGFVKFDDSHQSWRAFPATANDGNKSAARSWVQSMSAGGATCIGTAMVTCLGIANQSRKRDVQLILVGDGVPVCGGSGSTASDIASANFKNLTINTLFIGGSSNGQALFQQIANQNNGTFSVAGG